MEVRPRSLPALLSVAAFRCVLVVAALCLTDMADVRGESPPDDVRGHDEIVLISSRRIGTRCDADAMLAGLDCHVYRAASALTSPTRSWHAAATADVLDPTRVTPTIVYIHGNRVPNGVAAGHGLSVYRSMKPRLPDDTPVRFVIWSWPSAEIRGPVRDYRVKAARTGPVAWQVAWAINQLPADTPLAIVGYSYGARVATGTLHLLAGGSLNGRTTPDLQPRRSKAHAVLLAGALDADWLLPGRYHGRALEAVDELTIIANRRDPAMRFYHLTTDRDTRALGYAGPAGLASLRRAFDVEIHALDATDNVGRTHALFEYLHSSPQVARAWRLLGGLAPASTELRQLQMATRAGGSTPPSQGG